MIEPIKVWGYAEGCPACDELKTLLDLLSIPYDFIDITKNSPERAALKDAGFKTVPQAFTAQGRGLGDLSDFRKAARLGIQAAGCLG